MKSYVVLDLETTSIDPAEGDILEFACIKIKDGKEVARYEKLYYTDNLPEKIQLVTGIKPKDIEGKEKWDIDEANRVKDFIEGLPIVGQNVNFDVNWLTQKYVDHNTKELEVMEFDVIDTLFLSQLIWKNMPSYSLEYLSEWLGYKYTAHRAIGDCDATLYLLNVILDELAKVDEKTRFQAKTVAEQSGLKNIANILENPRDYITIANFPIIYEKSNLLNKMKVGETNEDLKKSMFKNGKYIINNHISLNDVIETIKDDTRKILIITKENFEDFNSIIDPKKYINKNIAFDFVSKTEIKNIYYGKLIIKIIFVLRYDDEYINMYDIGMISKNERRIWEDNFTDSDYEINKNIKNGINLISPWTFLSNIDSIDTFDIVYIDSVLDLIDAISNVFGIFRELEGDIKDILWNRHFQDDQNMKFSIEKSWDFQKNKDVADLLPDDLKEIFNADRNDEFVRLVSCNKARQVYLKALFIEINYIYQKIKFKNKIILNILNQNAYSYVKKMIELDDYEIVNISLKKSRRVAIYDPYYTKNNAYVIKIIKQILSKMDENKIVIYVSNMTIINDLIVELSLKSDLDYTMFAEGFGGSNRVRENFYKAKKSILICRYGFLSDCVDFGIDVVIFGKVSFDHPDDPFVQKIQSKIHMEENFVEFNLARMFQKIAKDLNREVKFQIFVDPTINKKYFSSFAHQLDMEYVERKIEE